MSRTLQYLKLCITLLSIQILFLQQKLGRHFQIAFETSLDHTRYIFFHSDYLSHMNPLFHRTGILKLFDIHTYHVAKYAYEVGSRCELQKSGHWHCTRNRGYIVEQFQRRSCEQRPVSNTTYILGMIANSSSTM